MSNNSSPDSSIIQHSNEQNFKDSNVSSANSGLSSSKDIVIGESVIADYAAAYVDLISSETPGNPDAESMSYVVPSQKSPSNSQSEGGAHNKSLSNSGSSNSSNNDSQQLISSSTSSGTRESSKDSLRTHPLASSRIHPTSSDSHPDHFRDPTSRIQRSSSRDSKNNRRPPKSERRYQDSSPIEYIGEDDIYDPVDDEYVYDDEERYKHRKKSRKSPAGTIKPRRSGTSSPSLQDSSSSDFPSSHSPKNSIYSKTTYGENSRYSAHDMPDLHDFASFSEDERVKQLKTIKRHVLLLKVLAFSLAILMILVALPTWSVLSRVLLKSQQHRNDPFCQNITDINQITPDTVEKCYYLAHDMTTYVAISGLWAVGSLFMQSSNILSSFLFYRRGITRSVLIFNSASIIITIITMGWTIILTCFTLEDPNWQVNNFNNEAIVKKGSQSSLTSASIGFAIICGIVVVLTGCYMYFLFTLRKFNLSRPPFWCWPITQCFAARPQPTTFHYVEVDKNTIENLNIQASKGEELLDPNQPIQKPTTDSQNLLPILSSLQSIQSTISTLATKVQAIESRQALQNDPFAYRYATFESQKQS